MTDKTPPINTTGKFVLLSPWAADPAADYRCEAIDGFNALADRGINVYNTIYQPKGLAASVYQTDLNDDINIITLMSDTAPTIVVPSSYIDSYPGELSVPHARLVISLDLGILPEDYNLQLLIDKLKETADHYVGITSTARIHKVPFKDFVSLEQSEAMATARANNIQTSNSNLAAREAAEAALAEALAEIAAKDAIIVALNDALP